MLFFCIGTLAGVAVDNLLPMERRRLLVDAQLGILGAILAGVGAGPALLESGYSPDHIDADLVMAGLVGAVLLPASARLAAKLRKVIRRQLRSGVCT